MITSARFTNYKLLRDVTLDLQRLTVIVGPNGVGKSSMLEGIRGLSRLAAAGLSGDLGRAFESVFNDQWHPRYLVSSGCSGALGIELVAGPHRFRLEAEPASVPLGARFCVAGETGEYRSDAHDATKDAGLRICRAADDHGLTSVDLLHLDPRKLQQPSPPSPHLLSTGEGLAASLQGIQVSRDGRFEAIEADVRAVVPHARRLRTTQAPVQVVEQIPVTIEGKTTLVSRSSTVVGAGLEAEWGEAGWIPAAHLSEGTVLVVAIITMLHSKPPRLVMIDDIDRGLHPLAQIELMRLLERLLAARPELQILATTHSPFIVDALDPKQVLVAGGAGNATTVKVLDQHVSWTKQKDYLKPGEFWSAVGESWVAEKKE